MQQLKAILGFPDKTPIDSVQVKITKVYQRENTPDRGYGEGTVQDAVITDGVHEMKLKVWNHPDISSLEGQEVVIHAGSKGKGVEVEDNNYKGVLTKRLKVSKTGQFQTVAVFHQTNPAAPATTAQAVAVAPSRVPAPQSAQPISKEHGMRVGMAINNAILVLNESDPALAAQLAREGKLANALVIIGSQIIDAAIRLERGDAEAKTPVPAVPASAAPQQAAPAVSTQRVDGPDEDVPF